jgi:hypothetical protein
MNAAGWPFDDPENTAVFTTQHVLEYGQPIVRVTHDVEDGAWQFHGDSCRERRAERESLEA